MLNVFYVVATKNVMLFSKFAKHGTIKHKKIALKTTQMFQKCLILFVRTAFLSVK